MNRPVVACLIAAWLATLCGCGEEPVRVREVPKPSSRAVRMIAVIIPRAEATWFLKITGPATAVTADEAAFKAFAASISFPAGNKPIAWSQPKDWSEGDARKDRHATLRSTNGLEVIVNSFPGQVGSVIANVNRWRGQIGLPPATEADLPTLTKEIQIDGAAATWVDLVNPGATPVALGPAKAAPPVVKETPKEAAPSKLTFTVPPGWQDKGASGMRAASFLADGLEITVIPLGTGSGGLTANVNRWRGEVGLPDADDAAVKVAAKTLPVDGKPAVYVDLVGAKLRTLGVIAERPDAIWFVKVKGPADAVAKQVAAFEAFVRSLKIPGGN